jgi:hypothetical protein
LLPFLLKMRPCFCSHDLVMNAVLLLLLRPQLLQSNVY